LRAPKRLVAGEEDGLLRQKRAEGFVIPGRHGSSKGTLRIRHLPLGGADVDPVGTPSGRGARCATDQREDGDQRGSALMDSSSFESLL